MKKADASGATLRSSSVTMRRTRGGDVEAVVPNGEAQNEQKRISVDQLLMKS